MVPLLFATRNGHKTAEFSPIIGRGFSVADLASLPEAPVVEETGTSFEENAILKAVAISCLTGALVVADDSGLEVDVLAGAPGLFSARFAGPNSTDADNIAELLGELQKTDQREPWRARFRCVLALARRSSVLRTFSGTLHGYINTQARGAGGFGYDPVFVPDGFGRTLAEVGVETKNAISHRAAAASELKSFLARSGELRDGV
ncbi:XTP/dITP diphosphatase [soil metagenome]